MLRSQASRSVATVSRRTTVPSLRVAAALNSRARTLATTPDPTKPTDAPSPSDVPKPGGNNIFLWLVILTGSAAGGWYYLNQSNVDPHEQRKIEEEQMKEKARQLREAGKSTAHAAVREGENDYEKIKAAGQQKLDQARTETSSAIDSTKSLLEQKLNAATSSAKDTYNEAAHKVDATYREAAHKADETYHDAAKKVDETTQSWGSWVGSWFGYGKDKAREAESKTAEKVAQGAGKVEIEAQKRT